MVAQDGSENFADDIRYHATKCDQHLARARLALVFGRDNVRSGVSPEHAALIKRAVGAREHSEDRIVEALSRSLFLDLKANFELFLFTCCRTWLRHDFTGGVRRLATTEPNVVKKLAASDRSTDQWEESLPVQNLQRLTSMLSALGGETAAIPGWSQVAVAFAVRHLIEHRNGRYRRKGIEDHRFNKDVSKAWGDSSWGKRSPEVPDKIEVTPSDFDATYEAMQGAVGFIAERQIAAHGGQHHPVRVAVKLPGGQLEEVAPMSPSDAAGAMAKSPGGKVRVVFDPRRQTAEEIASQMGAIRSAARRSSDDPDQAE